MRKKITLALMSLLLVPLGIMAQNVTIKSTNGSMIASVPLGTTQYDTFFTYGGFATWQHEQLSMVLTASDQTGLTDFGQLSNPANNLFSDGDKIQIGKGAGNGATVCYLTLSLPKGYRFTGYTIRFSKSSGQITKTGAASGTFNTTNAQSTFGETNSSFATYVQSGDPQKPAYASIGRGGNATIGRTSLSDSDMGNVLYFKLQGPNDSRAMITLEGAEFFFTAEANYTPLTTPGAAERMSAIDIPFKTGKVDYGPIQNRTYANAQRMSYGSANVKDLEANFTLYEANAYTDGEDFDGVTGTVVDYKAGSISIEDGYYRIGAADAANPGTEEHIYYIETPSSALLSDRATRIPVGYRITGARIDFKSGKTNLYGDETKTYNTFYISITVPYLVFWTRTYYLNSSGGATRTESERALWFIDEEGYIRTGVNGRIYLSNNATVNGNSNYAGTTTNKEEAVKFNIDNSGYIYYTENGTTYWMRRVATWGSNYFRFQNNTGDRVQRTMSGQTSVHVSGIIGTRDAQPYTIKLYGKDGVSFKSQTVDASHSTGFLSWNDMNNDAVKIGVIGTGLIQGTLTLQALDPYLDQMTVVCQDKTVTSIRLEQEFTASDFSVNGGEFNFYLPQEAATNRHTVAITFDKLKSKYFDESYDGGSSSHNSRLNFVRSAHYDVFGLSNNRIYNNRSEASAPTADRLSVDVVGNKAFKFNNVADLSSANGILTEYPFSLENYKNQEEPNDNANFQKMEFTVTTSDQYQEGYVFTTDETRYNIAPTTAVQHRAYAFYKLKAHVQAKTYTPVVTFKQIYNKTLYRELKADNTYGGAKEDAHYGAVVTANDNTGSAGLASTTAILTAINAKIAQGGDVPADAKHLLYIDLSQMKGVYLESGSTMESFAGNFATNSIVFLPKGSTASNDNVAYKMESGEFYAANNIVLTDMQPFYTPYDIHLRNTNMVSYERKIEKSTYDKSTKASVIMPFAMEVNNSGVHTNLDGSTISLHSMQATAALTQIDGTTYAYFPAISSVSSTQANHPYLVQVSNIPEDKEGFTVSQLGTLIKACPVVNTNDFTIWKNGKYLFDGEEAEGTATAGEAKGDYDFTNKGTYAGIKINKGDNVFYFANSMFVNSASLSSSYSYANIAPFRAFYATGTLTDLSNPSNPSGGAKLMNFGIILGEGEGDVPSGIYAVDAARMLDVNAPVYDLQGRKVATSYREAKSLLRSGMYVVNGVKIVVK